MSQVVPAPIDHVSYLVQPGMLGKAERFFRELFGWKVIPERSFRTEEQITIFLRTGSPIVVQLNDDTTNWSLPIPFGVQEHLAITVDDARDTVVLIKRFVNKDPELHLSYHKANPEGTKWLVNIRELMAFTLELVTADS